MIALTVGSLHTLNNLNDALGEGPFSARTGTEIFANYLIPFAAASAAANREG